MARLIDRIPASQRRLFIVSAVAAAVAGVFAGVVLLVAAGPQERPRHYEPFAVGQGPELADAIRHQRPLFFADPTGGSRGFVLTLEDGQFLALHVVPPGGTRACAVGWNERHRRLEDCHGRAYRSEQLARFPVIVGTRGDPDRVLVDLRRLLPAPERAP